MVLKKIFNHRIARFLIVGFSNAMLHFAVLNTAFYAFDYSKIGSSIIATVCAVTYSFFLNRSFVFKNKDGQYLLLREAALFALVTLTGMLIIHNLTYAGFIAMIAGREQGLINLTKLTTGILLTKDFVDINLGTVVGAAVAMVWNYNGYRLLVFRRNKTENNDVENN